VIVERYPPLVDGAFVIIAWVGIKLLIEYLSYEGYIHFEIPKWLSLGLIVVIFGASYYYAVQQERRSSDRSRWAEKLRSRNEGSE
jgi:predicted tellurium resistance membrane protein TerC